MEVLNLVQPDKIKVTPLFSIAFTQGVHNM